MRRYTELAALIDPSKAPKTDRNLILEDAVRVIGQLRVENNQLRQLNKLLEERVQEQEAKRGHALYQQSVMMQGGLNPSPRADGASTSRGPVGQGVFQAASRVSLSCSASLVVNTNHVLDYPCAGAAEPAGAVMDVPGVPSGTAPPAAGPASAPANGPQMDQTSLAMSMMNMAMQLLQSKGMAPPQAAMPSGGAQPAQPMWPMGIVPQVPQGMMPYMCPPVMGMQQQDASLKHNGDSMLMGQPGPTVNGEPSMSIAGGDDQDGAAAASVPDTPTVSKQPALQPMGYSHGYNFPPMGSMAPGWPPANMVDQHRDSQLRPPAA